jgi:hypothetical protein
MQCWSNAVLLFRLAMLELLQLLDLSFVICSGDGPDYSLGGFTTVT